MSSVSSDDQFSAVSWSPRSGLFMTIIALIAGQGVAAVIVVGLLQAAGMSSDAVTSWSETTLGQFILVLVAEALTLGALWLFLRRRRQVWKALGFTRLPRLKDGGYALLGGVVYFVLLIVVTAIAGQFLHVDLDQKQQIGFESVISNSDRLMAFVSLVILPPLVEEILFRGVLYGGFRTRLAVTWATLFTSLLFAFPHLLQGSGALLWIGAIDTFVLSVVLCYLREHSGSLWSCIFLHMIKNGIAYTYLFILAS